MAEQADALRSGRSGLYAHVGSTPTFGIDAFHEREHLFREFFIGIDPATFNNNERPFIQYTRE